MRPGPIPQGGGMPPPAPAGPPPNPAQMLGLQAEIAKAQAAAQTAQLNVQTKAIERDMRALELRIAAVKAGEGGHLPDPVVQGLRHEIAQLHGLLAEVLAMIAAPQPLGEAIRSAPQGAPPVAR